MILTSSGPYLNLLRGTHQHFVRGVPLVLASIETGNKIQLHPIVYIFRYNDFIFKQLKTRLCTISYATKLLSVKHNRSERYNVTAAVSKHFVTCKHYSLNLTTRCRLVSASFPCKFLFNSLSGSNADYSDTVLLFANILYC